MHSQRLTDIFLFLFGLLISQICVSQNTNIHHWGTTVYATDIWKYIAPTIEPDSTWRISTFNDSAWQTGPGGIGYGDGDDNTVILPTLSLYLRKEFTVFDTSSIVAAILNIDFDDAFVAYINDVEVARANIGTMGDYPAFNQAASGQHEAEMYQGGTPEAFTISQNILSQVLNPGNNLLAVQVHNATALSSDLSSAVFLHFGISDSSYFYGSNPPWFAPPMISSDLPLVIINTLGQNIVDYPRILVQMGIIDNGPGNRNAVTDSFNGYNGLVNIELRGSTSQGFPKKPFAFETQDSLGNNLNVSLLGMPAENDWILQNPYSDKTLMRNFLIYSLAREMGQYATRVKFCEVIINNSYEGVYVLMEQIKWDKNRVDIEKMDTDDIADDSLTGGYIVKVDKTTAGTGIHWGSPITNFQGQAKNIGFQFDYPKHGSITPHQESYIQNALNEMELTLVDSNFSDPVSGYRKIIDVNSFIDFFIANEITKNVDGYRLSTYINKQRNSRGGKISLGPVWDFNLGFGNANYCAGDITSGWALDYPCDLSVIPFWWHRLMQDSIYNNQLNCRWQELRGGILETNKLMMQIDSTASLLAESRARNFAKWPIFDSYVWPNHYVGFSYEEDLDSMKAWITRRLAWMDLNMPGSSAECFSPDASSVTISEINYHSDQNADSEDWFELWNKDTVHLDVSNWHIKDQNGFNSYTIGDSIVIVPGGRLVLSRDTIQFNTIHDSVANKVGSFNWGLNNNSDEIRIWDALNHPVLSMRYSSATPWPQPAAGMGWTLEGKDSTSLSSPSNWFAGCEGGSPGVVYSPPCEDTSVVDTTTSSELNFYSQNTVRLAGANSQPRLHFLWPASGEWSLVNLAGQTLANSSFAGRKVLVLRLPSTSGLYLIHVSTSEFSNTFKVGITR